MISAGQVRVGMIINYRGDFCKVITFLNQAVGRGSSKVTCKLRNIKSGSSFDARFRPDEKVEQIRIESRELQFLYDSGGEFVFMYPDTYEQVSLTESMIEDISKLMMPNFNYTIDFYEDNPISITPPRTLDMKVMETEPKLKGATASASLKPATLETGLVVGVPAFVEVDDLIKIDTTENKYMERVKS